MEFFLKEMGWTKAFLWIITLHTQHVLFSTQEHYCRIPNSSSFIKNLLILQGFLLYLLPGVLVFIFFFIKRSFHFSLFFYGRFQNRKKQLENTNVTFSSIKGKAKINYIKSNLLNQFPNIQNLNL